MNTKNLLALVVASSLAFPAFAAEKQTVETLSQELEAGGAANVTIQFPVGNVVVTGTGGDKIKADVDIRCAEAMSSDCRKVVEKAKIKVTRTGKGLVLKIEGWPKRGGKDIELAGRFEIPRSLNILAELEVGDFTTTGIEGDLDIDVEVGSVKIEADEDSIGSAILDAGVGKAVLKVDGNEVQGDGLVGQDLKWTGKGTAKILVDVNVGDILVTLD
jgi:hypothetical protein